MAQRIWTSLLLTCALGSLAACGGGGGGGGSGLVSTPPPPTGVLPPAHIGLVSSSPFAVQAVGDSYSTDPSGQHRTLLSGPSAQNVQFSYDPATNTYQISLPDFQAGMLANIAYNGTVGQVAIGSTSQVTAGSSSLLQPVFVMLPVPGTSFSPYTYTSFGSWDGRTGVTGAGDITRSEGVFAYGIPTAPGDVPVIGSASYGAEIQATMNAGTDSAYWVGGSATLQFNFADGALSGSMHPEIFDGFNGIFVDFGVYDFTQTVYSTGSTSFSGKFIVPGLPGADSFFNGVFTGPGAAELMARFQAPFVQSGQQGTLSGVWIGKKCC